MRYARRCGWVLAAAACVMGAAGAMAAEEGGGLGGILQDLGSADFTVRARAQAELAKVPRDQLGALRAVAGQTKDPEVKAALAGRISAMELDAILHPPMLSVDVKDMPLAELAAALNKQMGGAYIQLDRSRGGEPPRVTAKAQDQPLWEILRQLEEQAPIAHTTSETRTPTGTINTVKLVPATGTRQVQVVDGVMTVAQILGDPGTKEWQISFLISTDPRVRVTSYQSEVQVDKAIIQDGRAIPASLSMGPLPAVMGGVRTVGRMLTTGMPDSVLHCSATFAQDAKVKAIRELRGSVAVTVAESEDFVRIDLTKEPKPVTTPWGRFTVEWGGANDLTVTAEPARGVDAPGGTTTGAAYASRLVLCVLDKGGNAIVGGWGMVTTTSRIPLNTPRAAAMGPAAVLEIGIPGKTREVRLPVLVKDLEVPARPEWFVEPASEPGWGEARGPRVGPGGK